MWQSPEKIQQKFEIKRYDDVVGLHMSSKNKARQKREESEA
jgi:hypothetical protein